MAGFIFDTSIDSSETLSRALDRISHRGPHRKAFRVGKYFLGIVYSDEDYFELTDTHIYLIDGYLFDKPAGIKLFKDRRFNDVNGGWAGLIVDFNSRVVTVARDRWGEAPAYYNLEPHFAIASERKAFLDTKTNPIEAKLLITRRYLDYDYENKTTNIVEYYTVPQYESNLESFEEASVSNRRFSELAVDGLLKTSSNIGVTIGGIDSSSVAYMLSERGVEYSMFSVSIGDSKLKRSDLYTARRLAEFLNHDLIEVILEEEEILESLKLYSYICEEPSWVDVSVTSCFYELASRAKLLGVTSMFTGMGVDVQFGSSEITEAFYYDPKKFIAKRWKDMTFIDSSPVALDLNKSLLFGGGILEKTPFIEYGFVDHALSVPVEYRKVAGKNKATFRNAFKGSMPDDLIYRPKINSMKGSNMFDNFKGFGKEAYKTMYRETFDNAIK